MFSPLLLTTTTTTFFRVRQRAPTLSLATTIRRVQRAFLSFCHVQVHDDQLHLSRKCCFGHCEFGARRNCTRPIVFLGLQPSGRKLVRHSLDSIFERKYSHVDSFNNWNFYNGWDVNNTGTVEFQTQDASQQLGLTSLNSAGNTIIKVDNTTSGVGNASFLRPSVKILTDYTISSGNLLLFDAVHMPFGCSVWPAFWSQGPAWPDDGEIDIMEGVNLQVKNDISLHTLDAARTPPQAYNPSRPGISFLRTASTRRTSTKGASSRLRLRVMVRTLPAQAEACTPCCGMTPD